MRNIFGRQSFELSALPLTVCDEDEEQIEENNEESKIDNSKEEDRIEQSGKDQMVESAKLKKRILKIESPSDCPKDVLHSLKIDSKRESEIKHNFQAKQKIPAKLEWPIIAEIANRLCLILFPLFTVGLCGFYIISGFSQLYEYDEI